MAYDGADELKSAGRLNGPTFRVSALFGVALLVLCCTATCNGGGDLKPELIPGTELIEPSGNAPWFTISPSEKSLAFLEIDSIRSEGAVRRFHLVTIDLTNGVKTHHDLHDLPTGTFPPNGNQWEEVQMDLEVAAWIGEELFVQIRWRPGGAWIAFAPGTASARIEAPVSPLHCSDCPSPDQWKQVMTSFGLPAYDSGITWGHVAYRDGEFSKVVYRRGRFYDGAAIERVEADKAPKLVFVKRERFKNTSIGDFRVSPDEKYLAYTLGTSLRAPFPTPTLRDRVYVRDLQTGEERCVPGDFRVSGNLIWSSDSKELYYAVVDGAIADGQKDGLFRVILR